VGGGGAHRGLASRILGTAAGWCRRVGAMQGEQLRRGHRAGAGMAELRCGDGLPLLAQLDVLHLLALLLLLLFFSSSSGVVTAIGKRAWGG
jgi:hypothetical protein